MKTIKLTFDYTGEEVSLPLEENLLRGGFSTYKELKKAWEEAEWGYTTKVQVRLANIDVKNPEDVVECTEFWEVMAFKEFALNPEHYNTPFDENSQEKYFCSDFAWDCFEGMIYSKDFAYFNCSACGRTICEQNPSNGWHVQYRIMYGEQICLECYEEEVLKNGMDVSNIRETGIPGMFFEEKEILEAEFKPDEDFQHSLVGSGYSDYKDPDYVIKRIIEHDEAGKKVVVGYDSMAIGGMGGYVSLYTK